MLEPANYMPTLQGLSSNIRGVVSAGAQLLFPSIEAALQFDEEPPGSEC